MSGVKGELVLPYELLVEISKHDLRAWYPLVCSCKSIWETYKHIPREHKYAMFMKWKTKNSVFWSESYWEYIEDGKAMPHVVLLRYDTEGRLLQESQMYKGRKWGKTVTYYRYNTHSLDESIQVVLTRAYYVDDELHGKALEYHDNGVIGCISNYNHGVLHGEYYTYHDNGKRYKVGQWLNGIMVGEWTEYSRDGKVISCGVKSNNTNDGKLKRWCVVL
ncbi:MORN repeat-containing protein [Faustovirus ST1]|nr:MORN repeat-containing protein [Faustovirus ST1]